jgi:hypothetical protein
MAFITFDRILPEQTAPCTLNIDTIIWLQDIDGKCEIMTVDAHEIQCKVNSDEIRRLISAAGSVAG